MTKNRVINVLPLFVAGLFPNTSYSQVDFSRDIQPIFAEHCTACHGIDDYAYNALGRNGWDELVASMVDRGASIEDADRSILLDWLVAEFGPDSTPFPREYVVTPVDSGLFVDDDAARDYLVATCAVCHSLDRVDTALYEKARWQATVANMRARGAAVADENVEALGDYLTRKHGSD